MILQILKRNNKLYADLLYNEILELISLLSDNQFTELCECNAALLAPISQDGGSEYLKQVPILLQIRHAIEQLDK